MTSLANLFGAAVRVRNTLYDRGALSARRLDRPVISIGNLSVGGAGKTPFVLLLGGMLKACGIDFDVLSRGYGRKTRGAAVVDPGGLPAEYGDEPLLIARKLNVPVVVGEDRLGAGREAERRFPSRIHLLDDGFQHRALARDFDIVLVTPDDARERLLPQGRLREPITSLRRADAVVLASGADPQQFPLEGKLVWRVRRGIDARNVPPRAVAFCGIARPQNFFVQLRKANVEIAAEAAFRDHRAYTDKDIRELLQLRARSEAGGFVTTEKDAVNLGPYFSALEPLAVVPVKMQLENAEAAVNEMLRVITERRAASI
jgi:tetraacyldisaccharide 4'-kinase